MNFNEYTSNVQSNKCHLNTIEVALPKDWVIHGNTTKYFENYSYPGVCVLIGENCDIEEDIAKNLELFRGTDFYRNRIRFLYDEAAYDEEYISGKLINDRLDKTLYFSGFYIKSPKAYIFCLCDDEKDKDYVKELANEIYSSKSICKE